jgi:hypothetical protein
MGDGRNAAEAIHRYLNGGAEEEPVSEAAS